MVIPDMVEPSAASAVAFVLVVVVVAAMIVGGAAAAGPRLGEAPATTRRRAVAWSLGVAAWLGLTAWASGSGALEAPGLPPRAMLFMAGCNLFALALALSPAGARFARGLPVWALVGFHGFRLPLELVLHRWYVEGVLPPQMTYVGRNLDIITGALGLGLGLLLWRWRGGPRPIIRACALAFNLIGLALLINVAAIAVLSAPFPFRVFMNEPAVLLVFHVPYGWIVPMCVAPALAGHVVLFRWLRVEGARAEHGARAS
ncbi:MAG: hypothetical protein KC468_21160 [Myxococcales bacterium]|nr:hypothetical protein [Myxococcales bacterium]